MFLQIPADGFEGFMAFAGEEGDASAPASGRWLGAQGLLWARAVAFGGEEHFEHGGAVAVLLDETAECLGAALAGLINLFLPERILLGGWTGLLIGPRLLPEIRRYAQEYALSHAAARTTIEMGRLGPDAVTVGAATLPLSDFLARGGSRPNGGPEPGRKAADGVRPRRRGPAG